MEELFLIYVHEIGIDWKGLNMYEFIFSNTKEDIDGDDWDAIPASGRPSPPHEEHVVKVGRLSMDIFKFHVVQQSDSFSVWDAVDGAVGLAWEDMDEYLDYPEKRLVFHFGEEIKSVEEKLYEHDLILEYNKQKNVKLKKDDIE